MATRNGQNRYSMFLFLIKMNMVETFLLGTTLPIIPYDIKLIKNREKAGIIMATLSITT